MKVGAIRDIRRRLTTANRVLLGGVVATSVVAAILIPWGGIWGVDNRTYVEAAAGVLKNGLPYLDNGTPELFAEQRTAWNVPRNGHAWSAYPPLFAYVAALPAKLDGVRGMYRMNALLVGVLALVAAKLTSRLSRHPLAGGVSATIVALGVPLWASSVYTLAQPVALLANLAACLTAVRAIDAKEPHSLRYAALTGVFAGLGALGHMHMFAMGVALSCGLALGRAIEAHRVRIDATGLARAGVALGCMGVMLVPLSLLNHLRYGSYDPLTYGPCVWAMQCRNHWEGKAIDAHGFLGFVAPTLLWAGATILGGIFARRTVTRAAVVVVSLTVFLAWSRLTRDGYEVLSVLYGFFVDVTPFDVDPAIRPPSGPGRYFVDRVILSLFQHSPTVAFAIGVFGLAPTRTRPEQRLLLLPVLALMVTLGGMARYHGLNAFGWSYSLMRYVLYGAPILACLAAAAVTRFVPLRRGPIAFGVVVAVAVAAFNLAEDQWASAALRILELRVPLFVAAAGLVVALLTKVRGGYREAASLLVIASIALSVGTSVGDQTAAVMGGLARRERDVQRTRTTMPSRFALVGYGVHLETVMGVRIDRDVEYTDLVDAEGWGNLRKLVDRWEGERRPIFAIFPPDFEWPEELGDIPARKTHAGDPAYWVIGTEAQR
ncbi:MAG: glycosyltransferase family 39 protein [Polyangiaceae bacterium]